MADNGRRRAYSEAMIMTGGDIHRRTDQHMAASSRSGPSDPPELNSFRDGGGSPAASAKSTPGFGLGINLSENDCALEESSDPPLPPRPASVRGHRRRSTQVTHGDLVNIRREVLRIADAENIDDQAAFERNTPWRPVNPENDPELAELNRAFRRASMSLNGGGMPNNGQGSGIFTNYMDSSPNTPNLANIPRQSPSPSPQHTPGQVNGGGGMAGMNMGMPMNAGHQMDINYLWEMVQELSEVLKYNREMTKGIISSAEEIMRRANTEGASPTLQQVNGEISAARIAELERALAKERRLVEILKREQAENTKLIGEYETAVGTMVEQIRNYCQNNNMHFLAQKRHYNNLLQAERDAHLQSRLDRDYWHAQTMKCAEMIRTAYRLRCEEEELPIRIVAGLQNEVRAYRNALGMEPEKPEEEYGWEILKDVPPGVD